MTQTIEWKKTQPGSTEAVQFTDGMLVTSEDLTQAMRYPLSVVQVLLKAWFGCGIVCGLDLKDPAEGKKAETAEGEVGPTGAPSKVPADCYPNFILTVEKGVALGCDGYPIEICGPLKLDLTPDPCRLDKRPQKLFIATRRVTAAEAAARPCGCGPTGGEPAQQCTRVRDHALVQAFDEEHLPAGICQVAPPSAKASADEAQRQPAPAPQPTGAAAVCACLKQCGECDCCAEPWVLLGSVVVGEAGLDDIDITRRRYVKPIACACAASEIPPPVVPPPKVEERRIAEAVSVTDGAEKPATPAPPPAPTPPPPPPPAPPPPAAA